MGMVKKGFVLWFTGLSGAGKSTLSSFVATELRRLGAPVEILDGDTVRGELWGELGFTREHRDLSVRRVGFISRLLARNGVVAITATISPYRAIREEQRELTLADGAEFVEVHMDCPLDVVSERDVKGLYKRALAGEIKNFTGVSDPYEAPTSPEVCVHSDRETIEQGWAKLATFLVEHGLLDPAIGQAANDAV